MKRLTEVGQQYGHWTIIGYIPPNGGECRWLCRCDCGTERVIRVDNLRSGNSKSCGCQPKIHGDARKVRAPEYKTWCAMLDRCRNPKCEQYHNYGGRGIQICDEWLRYENFLRDMGRKPSPSHSIERINNNGNYEPGNCKWATVEEQSNNRRNTPRITFNGMTMTAHQWALHLGIKGHTLRARLRYGWSIEDAITSPLSVKHQHRLKAV